MTVGHDHDGTWGPVDQALCRAPEQHPPQAPAVRGADHEESGTELLDRLRQAARRRAVLDDMNGRVDIRLGQLARSGSSVLPSRAASGPNSAPDIRSMSEPPGLTAATTSG